jgi:hypothetical protein
MSLSHNTSFRHYGFLLMLLLIPLSAAFLWGSYFEDMAYSSMRFAQNLAAGRGLSFDAGMIRLDLPSSTLAIGLLALFNPLAPLSQISLYLSALGWGVVGIIIYLTIRPYNSTAAALAAVLLVFSPIVTYTLASPYSWSVAVGWLAITRSARSQSGRSVIAASLALLAIWFDLSVLLLVGLLLFWRWRNDQRIPKIGLLVIFVLSLFWAGFTMIHFGRPVDIYPLDRLQEIFRAVQRSELSWLFLPFLILGFLVGVIGRYIPTSKLSDDGQLQFDADLSLFGSFILFWGLAASVIGSALAPAVVALAIHYLVALGLVWFQYWLAGLRGPVIARNMALAMAVLLVFIQLFVTHGNYVARPVGQYELEEEVAEWIQGHGEPDTTLYASRRVGFLADRPTSPTDARSRTAGQLAGLFNAFLDFMPEYFITGSEKEWLAFNGSDWLEDRYEPVTRFASDYAPQYALTVWASKHTLYDKGRRQPADVTLGNTLSLVAYQFAPAELEPGDDLYLTLYLEPTQPITVGLRTDIHLRHMQDGHVWAWEKQLIPSTVSGEYWQPGQVLAERIKLRTEENIPRGAYELQAFWLWPDLEGERWRLYQGDDPNPLDRIRLGYVIVPPPVDADLMEPFGAIFGDQIHLSGINVSPAQELEGELALSLFWEALRAPDNNYTVFVHLLNGDGDLVASHDGEPVDGTYPTSAWQPGSLIQDTHRLSLPAELPPGEYDLRIGLYLLETGERLPIIGNDGEAYPDHTLPLPSLVVGK